METVSHMQAGAVSYILLLHGIFIVKAYSQYTYGVNKPYTHSQIYVAFVVVAVKTSSSVESAGQVAGTQITCHMNECILDVEKVSF